MMQAWADFLVRRARHGRRRVGVLGTVCERIGLVHVSECDLSLPRVPDLSSASLFHKCADLLSGRPASVTWQRATWASTIRAARSGHGIRTTATRWRSSSR